MHVLQVYISSGIQHYLSTVGSPVEGLHIQFSINVSSHHRLRLKV